MCEVMRNGFLEQVVPGDTENCLKMDGGDGGR